MYRLFDFYGPRSSEYNFLKSYQLSFGRMLLSILKANTLENDFVALSFMFRPHIVQLSQLMQLEGGKMENCRSLKILCFEVSSQVEGDVHVKFYRFFEQ